MSRANAANLNAHQAEIACTVTPEVHAIRMLDGTG